MKIDLFQLFKDLFIIYFAWIIFATAFHQWGSLVFRKLRLRLVGVSAFFSKIWLGWMICILFFSVIHIFVPINWISSFFFYVPASIVFFYNHFSSIKLFLKSIDKRVLFAVLAFIFIVSLFCLQECCRSDSCMYHLNTIRWLNEFSVVPGLGNLHSRLGFNQSYFVYCASIRFFPFFNDYGKNIATSLILLILCIELILTRKGLDLVILAFFHLLPFSFYWTSSPNPDIASIVLQLVMFRYMINAGEAWNKAENKEDTFYSNVIMAALMGVTSVTVKLSNGFYAICLGIVAITFAFKLGLDDVSKIKLRKALILTVMFVGTWLVRGYIQTGYPLFPVTICGIDTEWTVSPEAAKIAEQSVYTFSRLLNYDFNSQLLKDYKWLPKWIDSYVNPYPVNMKEKDDPNVKTLAVKLLALLHPNTLQKFGYGMAVCLLLTLVIFIACMVKSGSYIFKSCRWLLSLMFTALFALMCWFFTAPDPRFCNALCLIMLCISFKLLKVAWPSMSLSNKCKNLVILIPFLTYFMAYFVVLGCGVYELTGLQVSVAKELPYKCTDSGLKVTLIYENEWPYDTYLLSNYATEFNPSLRLRGKTLQEGFSVK